MASSGSNTGSSGGGSAFSPTIFSDHSFDSHSQPEPWARGAGGNTVPPTDFPSLTSSTARYENGSGNEGFNGNGMTDNGTINGSNSSVNGSFSSSEDGKPLPGVSQRTINEGEEKIIEVRVSSLLRCVEACLQEKSFNCLAANFERVRKEGFSISSLSFLFSSFFSVP